MIRGYRLPYAGYLFLRIDDAARARALLGEVLPQVITAERWTEKPESGINLAVTTPGCGRSASQPPRSTRFPEEFRVGMARARERLGDTGESAPEHWEPCFRDGEAHVLVMVSAKDRGGARAPRRRNRDAVAGRRPDRGGLAGRRRHWRAGASTSATPTGSPSRRSRAAASIRCPARARRRQGRRLAPAPARRVRPRLPRRAERDRAGAAAGRVRRQRLLPRVPQARQDVAGFRRALREAAETYPGGEELLAAKLVGRWRDGTPLDMSPDRPDPALVKDRRATTRSTSARTRTACTARSARTCGG